MSKTDKIDGTVPSKSTGTNLYANILLLIASIGGGMSTDTATLIVSAVTGLIGAVFAIRNWIVSAHFSLTKSWINDPNNWAYLTAVLAGFIPAAATLVPGLKSLAEAIVSGNWGSMLTAAVTLVSLIYYNFIKKA